MLSAPRAAGFQLQIRDDVILLREFENFFEGGNALADIFASEPGTCIEAAERSLSLVVHAALAVGRALQRFIMDGYKSGVARELQIRFDERRSQSDRFLESGERVFRRMARGPAVPDDEHFNTLLLACARQVDRLPAETRGVPLFARMSARFLC